MVRDEGVGAQIKPLRDVFVSVSYADGIVLGGKVWVPGVAYHEAHLLRRDILGGDDEVALVFAVLGVEDDDEFASSWKHVVSDQQSLMVAAFALKHGTRGKIPVRQRSQTQLRLEYVLNASIDSSIESNWSGAGSVDGICKAAL